MSFLLKIAGFRRNAALMARDESGATAIEYAMILSLMTIVVVGGMQATGGGVKAGWDNVAAKVVAVLK